MTAPGTFGPEPPTLPAGSVPESGYARPASPGFPAAAGFPAGSGGQPPAPPAGPGVQPPFAAPPTEGDRRRVWIGLGLGGLALVLCCVGGVIAIVALGLTTAQAIDEQARTTVSRYLDAVRAQEYEDAYQLLCADAQRAESPDDFAARVSREPEIASYRVGEAEGADEVIVPVDLQLTNGDRVTVRFVLVLDRTTGAREICGIS